MEPTNADRRMGHEFIGIVEDVGADVQTIKVVSSTAPGHSTKPRRDTA
jgi:threonine dehydrogenase-like Zn-dependent dehydrogenase